MDSPDLFTASIEDRIAARSPLAARMRPRSLDDVVGQSHLVGPTGPLRRLIESDRLSSIIVWGPPGTGKTTTIINLINSYQKSMKQVNRGQVIHLNASDERGIDIIRSQIYQFVKTKNLFEIGFKFVVLDEVDYMTKNAQQALRYLLQNYTSGVRFCLICNYISRIDEGLQNELIRSTINWVRECIAKTQT